MPAVGRDTAPRVAATDTLGHALAAILASDEGWVAVVDGDEVVGALTPAAVHASVRAAADSA